MAMKPTKTKIRNRSRLLDGLRVDLTSFSLPLFTLTENQNASRIHYSRGT